MRRILLTSFFLLCSGLAIVASANNSWDLAAVVQDRILFYTRNMTFVKRLIIKEIPVISNAAYDESTQTMYLVDAGHMSIFSVKLEEEYYTATKIIQLTKAELKAITFDPLTRTLFWINTFKSSIVKLHVPLNGEPGSPVVVRKFPKFLNLQSITVDACKKHVYWSYGNETQQSVERINYDGSDRKIIARRNLRLFMRVEVVVEVHYDEGKLYWLDFVDGYKIKIEHRSLYGIERKLIVRVKTYMPNTINTLLLTNRYTIEWLNMNRLGWKFRKNDEKDALPVTVITTADHNVIMNNLIARDNVVSCSQVPVTEDGTDQRMSRDVPDVSGPSKANNDNTFSGKEYLEDEEEAREIRCLRGGLFNQTNKLCECQPGYIGDFCEISLCHDYCFNGECILNEYGQPECKCPSPYVGIRCQNGKAT